MTRRWMALLGAGLMAAGVWTLPRPRPADVAFVAADGSARLVRAPGPDCSVDGTVLPGCADGAPEVTWLELGGSVDSSVPLWGKLGPSSVTDLIADPHGERFLLRTRQGKWKLLYPTEFGGFVHPWSRTSNDGEVDWQAAPDFLQAAPVLFRKAGLAQRRALTAAVRSRGGVSGLLGFLEETIATYPRGDGETRRSDGAWGEAFRTLPCGARAELTDAMTRGFVAGGALPRFLLLRTLRYVDLTDPRVLDEIEIRLSTDPSLRGRPMRPVTIMLRALTAERPEAAAEIACTMLDAFHPDEILAPGRSVRTRFSETVLASIAASARSCAVAEATADALLPSARVQRIREPLRELRRFRRQGPRRDLTGRRRTVRRAQLHALLRAAAHRD